MEQSANNITEIIINTINNIFENIFSSIDNNLYSILDDITFVTSDILRDDNFERIFGTSSTNGILLISNSLLIGVLIFFGIRTILANFTYTPIENASQFVLKLIIFGICMNSSYFLVGQIIDIIANISLIVRNIGEELFGKSICFSSLVSTINTTASINTSAINIFSIDGIIKGTLTFSLLGLVFSYALRYIMIKVFILISPFAFLALSQNTTIWFFKTWIKNFFSLLFIQIIVAIILVILFSMNYSSDNLLIKFLYLGGIYALIRVNLFVKEFIGGISTEVQANVSSLIKSYK